MNAVIVYLLVYAVMNLGAFAVIIAVSRKTHSGEIKSFGGLFGYAPGLAMAMTIFLASLAGIPPLAGWFAKFNSFKAVLDAGTTSAYVHGRDRRRQHGDRRGLLHARAARDLDGRVPDGDITPIRTPAPIAAALVMTAFGTIVLGVLPNLVARFGNLPDLTGALAP